MRRTILSVIVTSILCLLLVSSTEAGAKKVTLFIPFSDSSEIKILENVIKIFESFNPDIRVDLTFNPYSDYDQKLQIMAFSGMAPDVFALDVFNAHFFRQIARPLDNFLQGDPIRHKLDPELIQKFTFYADGRLYGIPRSFNSLGLFYNKELFDQRGLHPPENWNDLVQTAGNLQDRQRGIYGIMFGDATQSFLVFAIANGAPPLIEDNENEALIDVGSNRAIRALEFYLELQRNFSSPPWVVGTQGVKEAFIRGQVGMMLEGSWASRYISEMNPDLNYTVAPLPSTDVGGRGKLLFATVYSIANQTKVPEEAWKLVKFLIGEESQKLWLESRIGFPFHKDLEHLLIKEYPISRAFYADMDVAKLYSFGGIGSLYIPEVERAIIKSATMGEAPDETLRHVVEKIENALEEYR